MIDFDSLKPSSVISFNNANYPVRNLFPAEVTNDKVDHISVTTPGGNKIEFHSEYFDPAPITQDALKRLGFEEQESNIFSLGGFNVTLGEENNVAITEAATGEVITNQLSSVHNLQNLFSDQLKIGLTYKFG